MSPPSSGSNNKPSMKPIACYLLHFDFLLGLFFDPENGGDMFLRNVGWHLLALGFLAELIFSALKMEAICSSETSVDTWFYAGLLLNLFTRPWRWWRYVPPKRRLTPAFTLVYCWTYFFDPEDGGDMFLWNVGWHLLSRWFIVELIFSTLKMAAICSSETSVDTCFHAGLLLNLFFRPWRWRRYDPPKRRWLTLNGLHGVISQRMVLLKLRLTRVSPEIRTQHLPNTCLQRYH
jgi:hypothetical protein